MVAQAGPAHAGHLHLLSGQLTTHGDALQALGNEVTELVNTTQREINREFTPVIQGIMHESYEYCMNERGSGSFMRMKAFMEQHVNTHHRRMFEKAVNGVKDKLLALARQAEDVLDENTARLYQEMQRDYHSIFGGHAQDFTGGQGRAIRDAKEKVKTALVGFEKPFREVVGFPDDDEEPKVEVDLSQDEAARQILGENNQAGSIDEDASDNEGEESFVRCTSKPVSGTWFDGDDDGSEDQREIPNSVRQ